MRGELYVEKEVEINHWPWIVLRFIFALEG